MVRQSTRLEYVALSAVAEAAIGEEEVHQKDEFRASVESVCQEVIAKLQQDRVSADQKEPNTVQLVAFGSLKSGFALKSSDMDLMLLSPLSQPPISAPESPIPRALEKGFLERGWGARLLTKTRIPIIQLCEKPSAELLAALKQRVEREESKADPTAHPAVPAHDNEIVEFVNGDQSSTHEHGDGWSEEAPTKTHPVTNEHSIKTEESEAAAKQENSDAEERVHQAGAVMSRSEGAPSAVKKQLGGAKEGMTDEQIPTTEEQSLPTEQSSKSGPDSGMDSLPAHQPHVMTVEHRVETSERPVPGDSTSLGSNSTIENSAAMAEEHSEVATKDGHRPATEESAETTTHLSVRGVSTKNERDLAMEQSDERTNEVARDGLPAQDIHSSAAADSGDAFKESPAGGYPANGHPVDEKTEVAGKISIKDSPAKKGVPSTAKCTSQAAIESPVDPASAAKSPLTGKDDEPTTHDNTSAESDVAKNTASAGLTRAEKKRASHARRNAARKAAIKKEREATKKDEESEDPFTRKLKTLHQDPKHDIWTYLQKAKKTFSKLEDSHSSKSETPQDPDHGARLVNAFIAGLADESLRHRVLDRISARAAHPVQSLADAWVYIEGEQCVMAWEGRKLEEASSAKEAEARSLVQSWQDLHKGVEASHADLNEAAYNLWRRIRSLPSVKLVTLWQRSGENSASYHSRAFHILTSLGGRDLLSDRGPRLAFQEMEILRAVVQQYLQGMRDEGIREKVLDYVQSVEQVSFAGLYHQQEAEYLISSVRKMVKGDPEEPEKAQIIDDYADLVRQHGAAWKSVRTIQTLEKVRQLAGPIPSSTDPGHPHLLEIPKSGVGIQCDINFSNHLAVQNTLLLRCYNQCDARVKPMVLAVKAWAKHREINSPYHGTLSSYGYVLMVLHFLANVASPPVVPNLQQAWKYPKPGTWSQPVCEEVWIDGHDVRFWRDEAEISELARKGLLTRNQQPLGELLRQFFEYYAQQGPHVSNGGYAWAMDVLSIRTAGGILSKKTKGWTGARTTVVEAKEPGQKQKEVRHRYLFAIEDPFETDHNIARTVTHNGIVAIRDEFRRAWHIISNYGKRSDAQDIEEVFKPVSGVLQVNGGDDGLGGQAATAAGGQIGG